jgi:hypothetical protein
MFTVAGARGRWWGLVEGTVEDGGADVPGLLLSATAPLGDGGTRVTPPPLGDGVDCSSSRR